MKERALLLFMLFIILLPIDGHGQDLPSAEILTADAAWCDRSNNLTVAEILITGEIDTSFPIYGGGEQEILTGDVTFLH